MEEEAAAVVQLKEKHAQRKKDNKKRIQARKTQVKKLRMNGNDGDISWGGAQVRSKSEAA